MAQIASTGKLGPRLIVSFVSLILLYFVLAGLLTALGMNVIVTTMIMGIMLAIQTLLADKLVLRLMGAKVIMPEQNPKLYSLLNKLCQRARLTSPKIAIIESSVPNAFAVGIIQRRSTIVLTTGLFHTLGDDELEGVVAHEISHIKSRDVLIMTLASFFSAIALALANSAGGDDDEGGEIVLVALAVWFASFLIMRAISRHREYAADKSSALVTGKPESLCSALVKISGSTNPKSLSKKDLQKIEMMNAFYTAPPLAKKIGGFLSTHPSTEDRIARLRALKLGDFHV